MRPKEVVADLFGVDRERIRCFKKQDVLHPDNPASKGGAGYTEHDVEELRKFVVLNKAGLTCGDIKKIQTGEWNLQNALEERCKLIFEEMERMRRLLHLSEEMMSAGTDFCTMRSCPYKRRTAGDRAV